MAKILKCPRCQEKIDVTDLSGGSTVKCEACGTMVRLASGSTGKVPQATPPPPPPPARKERGTTKMHKKDKGTSVRTGGGTGVGRQTDLFRKMSNAKAPGEGGRARGGGGERQQQGSNTGMIIAIAAAAIVVIGGVAFALMNSSESKEGGSKGSSTEASSTKRKKKDDAKAPPRVAPQPVQQSDASVFRPGARAISGVGKDVPDMRCSPDAKQTYEGLVSGGKVADVVAQDYTWITYIIDGMLSDNEAVAKGSMEAMHQIINKRKLDAKMSDLAKQSNIGGFNRPEMRSGEYTYWAQWYFTIQARNAIAGWASESGGSTAQGGGDSPAPRVAPGNAATEAWEETLRKCRSGGFHNSSNPEYYEFQRIKGMGKAAYPHLVKFIDHEDTSLGSAAVMILKELSGRSEQNSRVTEANKAKIKQDWEGWLNSGP